MLSSDIGEQVEVNGNWGTIGQPGFGVPVTIKLTGMSIGVNVPAYLVCKL